MVVISNNVIRKVALLSLPYESGIDRYIGSTESMLSVAKARLKERHQDAGEAGNAMSVVIVPTNHADSLNGRSVGLFPMNVIVASASEASCYASFGSTLPFSLSPQVNVVRNSTPGAVGVIEDVRPYLSTVQHDAPLTLSMLSLASLRSHRGRPRTPRSPNL